MAADRLLWPLARQPHAGELSRDEMRLAAARGDVEHGLGDILHPRLRLRRLYGRLHGPLRPRLRAQRPRQNRRMTSGLPAHAEIVVIGGGIIGCSTAYHLVRDHEANVVLIERGRLTGGSTWHAAGLVGQLRSSASITQVLRYSVDLYKRIESETGLATGWRETGCLRLACNQDRWTEFRRQ